MFYKIGFPKLKRGVAFSTKNIIYDKKIFFKNVLQYKTNSLYNKCVQRLGLKGIKVNDKRRTSDY